ncbi:helix-turn-helix domain-containing protein [Primorskyibacter sp. S87]|uniref:helix-turn-helix domain-containing protein n=1 Tax=Primorskyibacter sp. S87 TaxID=3415126 RepID=UPI003C7B333E
MARAARSPDELRSMFGENLRILSKPYPSISDLSRQLGINRTQFNRYLSGESFPRPDVLDRICSFFKVDARIILEPVSSLNLDGQVLNGPFLAEFLGTGLTEVSEASFPSGFYQFSRRSFVDESRFLMGLIYIFREDNFTYLRGYEAREALSQLNMPLDANTREFRGYVTRQENGIAFVVSRRNSMTCSFNYLSRAESFENNFWAGYVTRSLPEYNSGNRAARLVYEHLGRDPSKVLPAARRSGFCTEEELPAYHRKLLQPDQPFR